MALSLFLILDKSITEAFELERTHDSPLLKFLYSVSYQEQITICKQDIRPTKSSVDSFEWQ
jgi:PIN domain nuclease of toxin-antitoxin system